MNLDRLHGLSQLKPEDAGVKVQLCLDRPLDILRAPETMALPGKKEGGVRELLALECVDDQASLGGRHHLVFLPLEEDDGTRDLIDVMDGRAFPEKRVRRRSLADEMGVVL